MNTYNLTPNGTLLLGQEGDKRKDIVLQVVSVTTVNSKGKDRYKVTFSDGVLYSGKCIMAASVLPHLTSGRISQFTVVRITEATVNKIKNQNVILVMNCEVLGNPGVKIGNPQEAGGPHPQQNNYQQQYQQHQNNYQQPQQQYQQNNYNRQPQRNTGNSDDISRDRVHPIESLGEYSSGWTIKARVTKKGEPKTWSRDGKGGRLMSVDFVDDSGEIRAVMFNEDVDRLGNVLEEGRVFYVKGGRLKQANPKFNVLSHSCEITFSNQTIVQPAEEDMSLPRVKITSVPIASLDQIEDNGNVDVIGVIEEVGELVQGHSEKSKKDWQKRNIKVCDNSNGKVCVDVALWGDQAQNFNFDVGQVVAITKCRKTSFNNVSLSTRTYSQIIPDPHVPEAGNLMQWYLKGGRDEASINQTQAQPKKSRGAAKPRIPINVAIHPTSYDEKGNAYVTVRCVITQFANRDPWYDSCPGEGCLKKVTLGDDGMYHCNSCQGVFNHSEKRYILSLKLSDYSGHVWATGFEQQGMELFGMTANDLAQFKSNDEEENEEYDAARNSGKFKEYCCTLKIQQPDPSAQFQRNASIVKMWPVSNRGEAWSMATVLDKILAK